MKKALFALLFTAVVFSCAKQEDLKVARQPGLIEITDLSFDFTVKCPEDTRAVKSRWESGDKVFIFFSGLSTGYVTLEYGTAGWSTPEVSGSGTISPDGTLTAVYLPFGNDDTPSYGESGWAFGQIYYSYYLVSEKTAYTVNGEVTTLSATMLMENPEGYVQFFVPDDDAVDGAYTLETDAVRPVGVRSIGDDGSVTESQAYFSYPGASDPMPGYAYDGGYLFSGKLVPEENYTSTSHHVDHWINFVGRYYFVKTKVSDGSREDYCTSAVTLTSHFAARLPENGSTKWVPVGPDKYVDLGGDVKWATCNLNCDKPEEEGDLFYMGSLEIMAAAGAPSEIDLSTVTIPERSHGQYLIDNCVAEAYMIRAQVGLVMKSTTTDGFIFLPCTHRNYAGDYVFGYDQSRDEWYAMEFNCELNVSVSLASTLGHSTFNTMIRPVMYKDGVPRFSTPFNSEVEL